MLIKCFIEFPSTFPSVNQLILFEKKYDEYKKTLEGRGKRENGNREINGLNHLRIGVFWNKKLQIPVFHVRLKLSRISITILMCHNIYSETTKKRDGNN